MEAEVEEDEQFEKGETRCAAPWRKGDGTNNQHRMGDIAALREEKKAGKAL
jgi:hypothetical protein